MNFPSKLIEDAVNEMAKLPGIGKKTALRLVLFLLKSDESLTEGLTEALTNMREGVSYCRKCFNIADKELCMICESNMREKQIICVVESTADVLAIENTGQYTGLYHVLGGVISPIEGIGPSDIRIDALLERIRDDSEISEIILALNATMEADTTAFYITKKLRPMGVKVSSIARGVPVGGELEYTDEITLGRSIVSRVSYE